MDDGKGSPSPSSTTPRKPSPSSSPPLARDAPSRRSSHERPRKPRPRPHLSRLGSHRGRRRCRTGEARPGTRDREPDPSPRRRSPGPRPAPDPRDPSLATVGDPARVRRQGLLRYLRPADPQRDSATSAHHGDQYLRRLRPPARRQSSAARAAHSCGVGARGGEAVRGENWLLEAAQRFRQRVEVAVPLRDPRADLNAIQGVARCVHCGKPLDEGTQTAWCRSCRPRTPKRPCCVEGCDRPAKHGRRCRLHRHGDPEF